ncbi:MAG: hypothetical protein QM756_45770 [Polyangiaceae bacterium]
MVPPAGEHDCDWKDYALALQKQLADVAEKQKEQQEQLNALKQKLFGRSREKMPPMSREVKRGQEPNPEKTKLTRQANAELRAKKLETELVELSVPAANSIRSSTRDRTFQTIDSPSESGSWPVRTVAPK